MEFEEPPVLSCSWNLGWSTCLPAFGHFPVHQSTKEFTPYSLNNYSTMPSAVSANDPGQLEGYMVYMLHCINTVHLLSTYCTLGTLGYTEIIKCIGIVLKDFAI